MDNMLFGELNLIYCSNNNHIIGINNDLYIKIKEDLLYFKNMTSSPKKDNYIVMGYNTWLSIGEKPLPNRINIVITKNNANKITNDSVIIFSSFENLMVHRSNHNVESLPKMFVIGGAKLYEYVSTNYNEVINNIYHTHIIDDYDYVGACKFKMDLSNFHKITSYKHNGIGKYYNGESKNIDYYFDVYKNVNMINNIGENNYLELIKDVLNSNNVIQGRNGNVISQFGKRMEFDLTKSFPLLTTKKVGWKTVLRELIWFMNGSTDNKLLKDKKVNIWNANASKEFLESRGLDYEEDDLGPVYGFQWRHFGADYVDCKTDYSGKGKDQLQYIIDEIKNNPSSRRLILNSWNAMDIDKMALPPCHVMVQFNIDGKFIDCQLYQRSGDMFLGVPFNISSYAFLLSIIGHITGYIPRKFIHILGDCHIYEEHVSAVKEQLLRKPNIFPTLSIDSELKDIDNIKEEYFTINNYFPQAVIRAPMIA